MTSLTEQDTRALERFIKFLCLKSVQVIVQSRLGKLISTKCIPSPSGADWFNLAVKDYPEIQQQTKAALSNGNIDQNRSLAVEISLRTSDGDFLALEVWSIGMANKCENVRIHHTVYNHMTLLLKSLMCLCRVTPAYKLARNQGNDYVICYKVYMGQLMLADLGEGFKTLRIGSVGTPMGTITMSAAYRSCENLHVSTKSLSQRIEPLQVEYNHFSLVSPHASSPARPCYTLRSRLRTLSNTNSESEIQSSSNTPPTPILYNTSYAIPFGANNTSEKGRESCSHTPRGKTATFVIGTPPQPGGVGHSVSSPVLCQRRASYSRRKDATTCRSSSLKQSSQWTQQNSSFSSAMNERSDSCQKHGTSLPIRQQPSDEDFWLDGRQPHVTTTTTTTTTCSHWRNNVLRVTAGFDAGVAGAKCNMAGGTDGVITGAFVSGSRTAERAREALSAGVGSLLPFSDLLLDGGESGDDDDSSRKSDSDTTSPERNTCEQRSSRSLSSDDQHRHDDDAAAAGGKADDDHTQDFVLVELNAAFGRDDSSSDLCAFYRECENVPDLVMFDHDGCGGDESDENLLDLAKQLEDYQRDATEFDVFVQEIQEPVV